MDKALKLELFCAPYACGLIYLTKRVLRCPDMSSRAGNKAVTLS